MGNCQSTAQVEEPATKTAASEQDDVRKSELAQAAAKEELLAAKEKARMEEEVRDLMKKKDLLDKADREAQETAEAKAALDTAAADLETKKVALAKETEEARVAEEVAKAEASAHQKEQEEADAAAAELKKAEEMKKAADDAHAREAAEAAAALAKVDATKAEWTTAKAAAAKKPADLALKAAVKKAEAAYKTAEKHWEKEASEAAVAAHNQKEAESARSEAADIAKKEAQEAEDAKKKAEEAKAIADKETKEAHEAITNTMDAAAAKSAAQINFNKEVAEDSDVKKEIIDHEKELKDNKAKRDAERQEDEEDEEGDDAFGILPDKAALAAEKQKAVEREKEAARLKAASEPPKHGCWKIDKKARNGSMWSMKQTRWLVISLGQLHYYEMKDMAENLPPYFVKPGAEPKNDMKDGVIGCTAGRWHDTDAEGAKAKTGGPKRRASTIGGDDALTVEVKSPTDKDLICQFSNAVEVENFLKTFAQQEAFYSANRHVPVGKPF